MKLIKPTALLAAAISSVTAATNTLAEEGGSLTANIGYASEYYYRGIFQNESSGSAGIDYENGGFAIGSWVADVGDGLEVDLYGSYTVELGDVALSAGFTGYYYTGEFDDTYEEINLGASWGPLSIDYSVGSYENFDGPEQDYDYTEVSYQHEIGLYAKYATFGKDFDGDYIELGYGTTVSDIDFGIALIFNSDELSDQTRDGTEDGEATNGEALIFSVLKSFDL
jgi:uncharacterized protein (TIGR02001 family)